MSIDKMAKALGQQKNTPHSGWLRPPHSASNVNTCDRTPITSQLNAAGQHLRDQIANAAANEIMFLQRRPIPPRCRGPKMST